MTQKDYSPGSHPSLPPPISDSGVIGWARQNLFSSLPNTLLTLFAAYGLYLVVPPMLTWMLFDANFTADSRDACYQASDTGACWGFIEHRIMQFLYWQYPEGQRWRLNLAFVALLLALWPILFDNAPYRKQLLYFSLASPLVMLWLILGDPWILPQTETRDLGGFTLTLIIGVTGILFSLPLGILLALGRNSDLITIRAICTTFIEFIRGVPLITLLFVASVMLNYFLPPGTNFDLLLRVLIMVTLFSAAYLAEVIRGGLQAIPKGQIEAADSMGLNYWQSMRFIVLPQALKISIPGIVNSFIALYKDTTLVVVIAMNDLLGVGMAMLSDTKWQGLSSETYLFIALFFFISCFSMSRYSLYLEKKFNTGYNNTATRS